MVTNVLARKAHDVTQATALSAESPRRWASIFAHFYCDLLGRATPHALEEEAHLMGLDAGALARLAALAEADDEECLAETVRVLSKRAHTEIDGEPWLARIGAMLHLDDEGHTVLEP